MALLTTSQLTFYDLKDAYHVEINPDCIVINCDEKCVSKEETNIDISYGIYCGSTRVSGTAKILNFEINGSQIVGDVTNCSNADDGHVRFVIPKDIDVTSIDSVHIEFEERNDGDTEIFTFDKYIQFIKVTDGASGTGMVFKIYSENGTAFREDMSTIELETVVFVGESRVEPSSYKWQWRDNAETDWADIPNETASTLVVNKDDEWALKTIRCEIMYNNNSYEDYISLTNDVNIYSAEIKFFHGSSLTNKESTDSYDTSNIFKTTDKYIVAYMELYKNGVKIDPLQTNKIAEAESVDASTDVITTSVIGTFETNDLLYFVLPHETYADRYNIIVGQYDGSVWHRIDAQQDYTYTHSNITTQIANTDLNPTKLMVVSKSAISKTLVINFTACKILDGSPVASVDGTIIDLNDPIIGPNPPDNPVDGTLWIDISVSPCVLKVWHVNEDGDAEWVTSQQIGGKVYTSIPYSYFAGDIWILNDNESCTYTDENGLKRSYGPGSMLKSSASRTTEEIEEMVENNAYPFYDWSDAQSKLTEMRDNVENYFEFNANTGLKIGQKNQKFYVQIDATEMGFYEVGADGPDKVVSIGNQSATIKNATLNEGAEFNCTAEFNNQLNIYNPYVPTRKGFAWKIEADGSLSLVCSDVIQKTIRGTWEDVFAAEEDGTYKQKYKIGDTLALDLGSEGVIDMQIAAFDADMYADGNGYAKITWVAKQILPTKHIMAPALVKNSDGTYQQGTGTIEGWTMCEINKYLRETIFSLIPTTISDNIKFVRKYTRLIDSSGAASSSSFTDSGSQLWIPSARELFGTYESNGPRYSNLFLDNTSRIKYRNGIADTYWTRTAMSTGAYNTVNSNGVLSNYVSQTNSGIVLCFCT